MAEADAAGDLLFSINYGREDTLACLPKNRLAEFSALIDTSVAKLAAAGEKPFKSLAPEAADPTAQGPMLQRTFRLYSALKNFANSDELAQLRDGEDLQAALQLQSELLAFKQAMLARQRRLDARLTDE